jgi:hypothetical protein
MSIALEQWKEFHSLSSSKLDVAERLIEDLKKEVACKHFQRDPDEPGGYLLCGHLENTGLQPLLAKTTDELFAYRELCAVVNHDGGHLQQEVGVPRAVKAGIDGYYEMIKELDSVKYEADQLRTALESTLNSDSTDAARATLYKYPRNYSKEIK